jgi:phosphoglycerate dehydrogenase-like enzyme
MPDRAFVEQHGITLTSLEKVLVEGDYVSLHIPLTPESKYLINTARGPLVNEADLHVALKANRIAGAGLDVFEDEPKINPYFAKSDRCIIQPHLGGLTQKARRDAERECLENIKSLFSTGRPVAPVNEILSK